MEIWNLWLAAAPIAGTIILLASLSERLRLRFRLPWIAAVVVLLVGSSVDSQCASRSLAISEVESRLFPTPESSVAVYDLRSSSWLQIGAYPGAGTPSEVRLTAWNTGNGQSSRGGGSAAPLDGRPYRVQLRGGEDDVRRLEESLDYLSRTRYGSSVLADMLQRDDVEIGLSDHIGLDLPTGQLLTTGGTAVTEGKRITISRQSYALKGPEVLAAMVAHELTHVAQNTVAGTAWWQWPWTTIDREATAHVVQAVVWAELRGYKRDLEQDSNLRNALDRDRLRERISANPAYPFWLAPDLAC